MSWRACIRKGGCLYETVQLLRWFPVLIVIGACSWGYYAYVWKLSIETVDNWPQRVVYLLGFHILLFLFASSYYKTIFTPPSNPPPEFRFEGAELAEIQSAIDDERRLQAILQRVAAERKLPLRTKGYENAIRYCEKCNCIKPDRSHHCSMCGECILKFDHHCPWVNNCVNFSNYKFFILFLGYGFTFCLWVFFTDLPYFIEFWKFEYSGGYQNVRNRANLMRNSTRTSTVSSASGVENVYDRAIQVLPFIPNIMRRWIDAPPGRIHLLFLVFVSAMFAVSLSALFFYHLYLTAVNRSTVESFRAPLIDGKFERNAFNHGIRSNYREVFGVRKPLWLLPIYSTLGTGVDFTVSTNRLRGSNVEMGNLNLPHRPADLQRPIYVSEESNGGSALSSARGVGMMEVHMTTLSARVEDETTSRKDEAPESGETTTVTEQEQERKTSGENAPSATATNNNHHNNDSVTA